MRAFYVSFCIAVACLASMALSGAEDPMLERLEFKNTPLVHALRVISEASGVNVVATEDAAKKSVSVHLRDIRARAALRTVCKTVGLWMREELEENVIRVMTAEEYQKDLVVAREENTKVFDLLYPNAIAVAQSIQDLYGPRVVLSLGEVEDDSGLFGPDAGISGGGGGSFGGGGGGGGGTVGFSRSENQRRQSTDSQRGGNIFVNDSLGGGSRSLRDSYGSRGSSRGGQNARRGLEESQVTGLTPEQLDQISKLSADSKTAALSKLTAGQPPVYVSVNRQHNLIVVRTSDSVLMKDLEKYIQEVDRPVAQVLLEVKIFQITLDDSFDSQFNLSLFEDRAKSNLADNQPANPFLPNGSGTGTGTGTGTDTGTGTGTSVTDPLNPIRRILDGQKNLGGLGNFSNLSGSTLVYQYLDSHLRFRMQMLAGNSRVKALATPTLLCANNSVARLFVGEQRPIVEGFETQTVSLNENSTTVVETPQITLRDVGVTLEIVPRINADRTVALRIFQESSNVNVGAVRLPIGGGRSDFVDTVSTANAEATIVGSDGKTLAIGGLIRKESSLRRSKVPFLGDIPYLGLVFSKNSKLDARNEIVLLVTPHILMTPEEGRAVSASRIKHLTKNPEMEKFLDNDLPPEKKSRMPGWLRDIVKPTEDAK